jgi:hypothetical protein
LFAKGERLLGIREFYITLRGHHFAIMFINGIDEIAITLPSCSSIPLMKLPAITLPSLCLQSDGKVKKVKKSYSHYLQFTL